MKQDIVYIPKTTPIFIFLAISIINFFKIKESLN